MVQAFECVHCDKETMTLAEMRTHFSVDHGLDHFCEKCMVGFRSRAGLKEHKVEKHSY